MEQLNQYDISVQENFGILIGEYLLRKYAQECFSRMYNNDLVMLNKSIMNGIKVGMRKYTILIFDPRMVYIYKMDKSTFLKLPLNGQGGFKVLREWASDYRDWISEVHFRKPVDFLELLKDSLQALRALRVLNFPSLEGPQQNSFQGLIQDNASQLEILRNCNNSLVLVPRQMIDRLIWVGSKCDTKTTTHFYRTIPIGRLNWENRIYYEVWFVKGFEKFCSTISTIPQEIANKIKIFRIQTGDWPYNDSTLHVSNLLNELANLKTEHLPNLQQIKSNYTVQQNNASEIDNDYCGFHPVMRIDSLIRHAEILAKCFDEMKSKFKGIEIEFEVCLRVVHYYNSRNDIGLNLVKHQMKNFLVYSKSQMAKTKWTKIEWNEEENSLIGAALKDNVWLKFSYRLEERINSSELPRDQKLQDCMKSVDFKFS